MDQIELDPDEFSFEHSPTSALALARKELACDHPERRLVYRERGGLGRGRTFLSQCTACGKALRKDREPNWREKADASQEDQAARRTFEQRVLDRQYEILANERKVNTLFVCGKDAVPLSLFNVWPEYFYIIPPPEIAESEDLVNPAKLLWGYMSANLVNGEFCQDERTICDRVGTHYIEPSIIKRKWLYSLWNLSLVSHPEFPGWPNNAPALTLASVPRPRVPVRPSAPTPAHRRIFHSYQEYLESDEWQAKRQEALRRAGYRCQACNSRRMLDVHHRIYPPWDQLGTEPVEDLTVFCRPCHNLFHHNRRLAGAER